MTTVFSNFKKVIALGLLSTLPFSAFAGNEDWTGVFKVRVGPLQLQEVTHSPNHVHFLFFTAGQCINLGQGTRINDFIFKQATSLCVNQNVETFTHEVEKLGIIVDKKITLGNTYTQ